MPFRAATIILSRDPDDVLVRAAAARAMSDAPPKKAAAILLPLLNDPSRVVRSDATVSLLRSGAFASVSGTRRATLVRSIQAVRDALMVAADRAESHVLWGELCELQEDFGGAIAAYEDAIRVQPGLAGPRSNLAASLEHVAENLAMASQLQERAARLRQEELPLIRRDASLLPEDAALQYRYGLALYLAGDWPAARDPLERAVLLDPDTGLYQTALTLLNQKLRD